MLDHSPWSHVSGAGVWGLGFGGLPTVSVQGMWCAGVRPVECAHTDEQGGDEMDRVDRVGMWCAGVQPGQCVRTRHSQPLVKTGLGGPDVCVMIGGAWSEVKSARAAHTAHTQHSTAPSLWSAVWARTAPPRLWG